MAAQAIACPLDLNDDGMVKPPIQQRGGDDGIAEDVAPFGKSSVGGHDHCAFFVSCVDQLEEQICAALGDGQVANFIDDEQRGLSIEPNLFSQLTLPLSLCQDFEKFCQCREL